MSRHTQEIPARAGGTRRPDNKFRVPDVVSMVGAWGLGKQCQRSRTGGRTGSRTGSSPHLRARGQGNRVLLPNGREAQAGRGLTGLALLCGWLNTAHWGVQQAVSARRGQVGVAEGE